MSEPKFTPGPWSACKGGSCQCGLIWDATGNCTVAIAQGPMHLGWEKGGPDCTPIKEAQQANARLIAAAPDLLEALQDCVSFFGDDEDDWSCIQKARAAIAKATKNDEQNTLTSTQRD